MVPKFCAIRDKDLGPSSNAFGRRQIHKTKATTTIRHTNPSIVTFAFVNDLIDSSARVGISPPPQTLLAIQHPPSFESYAILTWLSLEIGVAFDDTCVLRYSCVP